MIDETPKAEIEIFPTKREKDKRTPYPSKLFNTNAQVEP